jgi:hypothetical protein
MRPFLCLSVIYYEQQIVCKMATEDKTSSSQNQRPVVIFFSLIFSISWTVFILFLWFKTDFLLFYAETFGLSSALRIPKFKQLQDENIVDNFLFFLWTEFQGHKVWRFPFKLLTCVYCFAFWLSLAITFFYDLRLLALNYLLSILIFNQIKTND